MVSASKAETLLAPVADNAAEAKDGEMSGKSLPQDAVMVFGSSAGAGRVFRRPLGASWTGNRTGNDPWGDGFVYARALRCSTQDAKDEDARKVIGND